MRKRSVAAVLWFFTVVWAWNYVAALTGFPSATGILLGTAVAAFVARDPVHVFWPVDLRPTEKRSVATAPGITEPISRPL